jgi:hypothetical protein
MLENKYQSKAYYRFINNEKVAHEDLTSIFRSYSQELLASHQVILVPQDTTELDFTGKRGADALGCMEYEHRKGLYLHNQLLLSGAGDFLGIFSQEFFSRSQESLGKGRLRRYSAFQDKESHRWLSSFEAMQSHFASQSDKTVYSICDREGDIAELLLARKHSHIHYIIRSRHDRRSLESSACLSEEVGSQSLALSYEQEILDKEGKKRKANLSVRYTAFVGRAPYRKEGKLACIPVWVIEVKEENPPVGEQGI